MHAWLGRTTALEQSVVKQAIWNGIFFVCLVSINRCYKKLLVNLAGGDKSNYR